MKQFRSFLFIIYIATIMIFFFGFSSEEKEQTITENVSKQEIDTVKQYYFNHTLPLTTPVIFDVPILSYGEEFGPVFSPDGKELYFNRYNNSTGNWDIFCIKRENDKWNPKEEIADFAESKYSEANAAFTMDGKKVFWCSNRPITGSGAARNDFDIWYAERTENSWSLPVRLDSPVNTTMREDYPSVGPDGTLYFTSNRNGGFGGLDIYMSTPVDGAYLSVENMGGEINTKGNEKDAIVNSSDYLLFVSGESSNDIYISFKGGNGTFERAILLSETFNTSSHEYGPRFTYDNKYLFFTRTDQGARNAYWVDASILETYRN